MTRLGTVFWIGLVLASGFTTFKVKYAVQEIDDQLSRARKQAIAEQQEIRVLVAEWTYLNQPERLAELNRAFLKLVPVSTQQLQQRIDEIAWRAPAAPPDTLVAAAEPPPAAALPVAAPVPAAAALPMAPVVAPAAAPPAGVAPAGAAAIAVVPAVAATRGLAAGPAGKALPIRLAKAAPTSLDALIAQIADRQ